MGQLWEKLAQTSIGRDYCALYELYSYTTTRISVGISGSLTKEISTEKGVKQGCILVPLLFNLHISDITKLTGLELVALTIGHQKVSVLLYVNDTLLISLTRIGLKRFLHILDEYCKEKKLIINYTKPKRLFFLKRLKREC